MQVTCPDCNIEMRYNSLEYSIALIVCPSCGYKAYIMIKEALSIPEQCLNINIYSEEISFKRDIIVFGKVSEYIPKTERWADAFNGWNLP